MKDASVLIAGIEYKVKKLTDLQKNIEIENFELIKKEEKLQNTISEQNRIINQLEEKNKLLKIAKSIKPGKGAVDAKLKINELVREIDKCIGFLNK
ncbi:MAG: hypothetical protein K8R58_04515 [Bacteroidales bacterium]|nr:hypothetical protein [Bacteroidales bacterium]